MSKFLKKLVMVVRIVKVALRIAIRVVDVLDSFATTLSKHEVA